MKHVGHTTKQMLEAPQNAIYVWCSNDIGYAKWLAKKLGREDLRIVSPYWLESARWRGLEPSGLVLDHAYFPTNIDQMDAITSIRYRMSRSARKP